MSTNSRGLTQLNWPALVAEALRRRKAERLTQREHAALANVSVPTMAAFDRGEHRLSLAKAFDILRVVGLLDEPEEADAQASFVRQAFLRWQELTATLPEDSPARFPNGWYRFDYALHGALKELGLSEFETLLETAVPRHSGWPVFWVSRREELRPQEVDGTLECWLAPSGAERKRRFDDPAHCDFWRAVPSGRLFLMRGYDEDSQETFVPGSLFDTTLPIWRIGETLLHAGRLADLLRRDHESSVDIRFRALYSGLTGRVLRAWANPLDDLFVEGHAARSDEAILETVVPASQIDGSLAQHLFPLVSSLYERFGVSGLTVERVQSEITRLLRGRGQDGKR